MAATTKRTPSASHVSRTIDLARIVLICGLVFLHYGAFPNATTSPFSGFDPSAHSFATFIDSAVLFFFFSVVPLLSAISGWLFFAGTQKGFSAVKRRMGRRVVTLYMPLVAWNTAYVVVLYTLFLVAPGDGLLEELNIDFASANWLDWINAVFAVTEHPIAFQLWFVRDLFLTAMVSPILLLMLRYAPWPGAAVLAAIWLTGLTLGIFFRTDVLFFFYLGGLIRFKELSPWISPRVAYALMAAYVAIVCLRALAPLAVAPDDPLLELATRATRVIGAVAAWGVLLSASQTPLGAYLARYGGLAFFLHSAHWPLLAAIKRVDWLFVPEPTDFWMLVHYAVSVGLTIVIGLGSGYLLAQVAPGFFALLNGGRLPKWQSTAKPARADLAPTPVQVD